jgi:hypothetical protein
MDKVNQKYLVERSGKCEEDSEGIPKTMQTAIHQLQAKENYVVHQIVSVDISYGEWIIWVLVSQKEV